MVTCNALVKKGRTVLVCDKPLGHPPPHEQGGETWEDTAW